MKSSAVVIGILLVLINSSAGLIFTSYKPFNVVISDVSLLLSTILIYTALNSTLANGFKIGFTVLFAITGLIRFICSIFSTEQLKNNVAILIFITTLAIEVVCFFIGKSLKDY